MEFTSSVTSRDDLAYLAVMGELDAFTGLQLRVPVGKALDLGCRHFTVDLGHLTFIDAGGLGALVRLQNVARQVDGSVTFVDFSQRFRRTCDFAGLSDAFALAR